MRVEAEVGILASQPESGGWGSNFKVVAARIVKCCRVVEC